MHDYVVRVDQYPVRSGKPFDANVPAKSLFDLVGKLNSHRGNLPGRPSGCDHHVIGDVGLAGERNGNDLLRLIVIKRLQYRAMEVSDVDRRAAGFGGLSWTFGQGVSLCVLGGDVGEPKRCERAEREFVLSCQWGSRVRMAVADVVSGGRRRNRIAGALHSVQKRAWLEGWTNLLSQPIARAAWAAES